jgi:N-ethylmaleimide reductase
MIRPVYRGNLVANGGFTPESAADMINEGHADAISFGKLFISNPDLPRRIREGVALAPFDRTTFYTFDEIRYTDYLPASNSEVL